jgi:peptide/nickel transport system ATP-binding protein
VSETLLEAREVSVRFGQGDAAIDALDRVTVTLGRGETVGVVGESGSGKSTLARVFAGLQRPSGGDVVFDGKAYSGAKGQTYLGGSERRRIQMVFQDPYGSVNPRMRAVDAVAEAYFRWHKVSRSTARAEALRLLQSLGIAEDQAFQLPKRLSGGQRQRVSVARAIAPGPDVLIADEPTSAIDQSAQAQLLNLFLRLQADRGLAILFISHDLGLIRYATQRAYVMKDGLVVEHGPTGEIFANPKEAYTQRLLASIPGRRRALAAAAAVAAAAPAASL